MRPAGRKLKLETTVRRPFETRPGGRLAASQNPESVPAPLFLRMLDAFELEFPNDEGKGEGP